MRRIKSLPRLIIFTILCAVLFSPTLPGRAQEPQTITGTGTLKDVILVEVPLSLTITFPPAGGPVTGSSFYQGPIWACTGTMNVTMIGTFAGGDGGAASGTLVWKTIVDKGELCVGNITEFNGTWSGNFYANGAGNGNMQVEGDIGSVPWQVTYSAEEFSAALTPVTSEYIYKTYGIRVEDSFGGDGYAQTAWSDHELNLLNDVLKQVPPDLLKNMALSSIIRSKVYINENGNQDPDTFGVYFPCKKSVDLDCTGSSAGIRIFDTATSPYDFADDPNGDKQFKATILHEMIHAMQYHKGNSSEYTDPNTSPLVKNYIEATRPYADITGKVRHNGWDWYTPPGEWQMWTQPGNYPPTKYGQKNPTEDMSESAMIYVYDPQKLKAKSPKRYNFIRDQMFGGVEYENGIQKKP